MNGTQLSEQTRAPLARSLKVLIPLIQADVREGTLAGMEYYADAGDKLAEAKAQVAPGHWGSWLSKNFKLSRDVAGRYMRVARLRAEGVADLPGSLREMTGDTERRRKQKRGERDLREGLSGVDSDLFSQARQTEAREVELHREIAVEVIDLGYKALASRLHPDHGGSKDAMARLNRVRIELKGIAKRRRFV